MAARKYHAQITPNIDTGKNDHKIEIVAEGVTDKIETLDTEWRYMTYDAAYTVMASLNRGFTIVNKFEAQNPE
ncbi:MAG: hypothetical protein EON58_13495 [Alphaproteobacteria bacterium]|nr:MAG: hypothetical protein EON58_13495 [Alphaproteobacteria bacterium]